MGNYVKPNIIQKFSGVKVDLWEWLEGEIGNQREPFEVNQGELADRFNVSRTAIINALKTFVSANLLEKVSSGRGRGNHSRYRLLWKFREQSELKCNPSRVYSKPKSKSLTKGRQWRYFAYKFRTTVENSSLANESQVVVGKILKFLKGKPANLFQEWLTHLKHWLNGPPRRKTLKDFYVFLHNGLMEIYQSWTEVKQTGQRIRKQREQQREVKKQYQANPPPRLRDYGSFAGYQKAIERWDEDDSKFDKEQQPAGTNR